MSYAIYDINGKHVGDFTSAGALLELWNEVKKNSIRWPDLAKFIKAGHGDVTKKLLSEVRDFQLTTKDRMLKDVAKDFYGLLMKSEEHAIISD